MYSVFRNGNSDEINYLYSSDNNGFKMAAVLNQQIKIKHADWLLKCVKTRLRDGLFFIQRVSRVRV